MKPHFVFFFSGSIGRFTSVCQNVRHTRNRRRPNFCFPDTRYATQHSDSSTRNQEYPVYFSFDSLCVLSGTIRVAHNGVKLCSSCVTLHQVISLGRFPCSLCREVTSSFKFRTNWYDCACVLSQQLNPRSYDTRNRSRNGSMSVWTVKVFSEPFQIRTAKDVFSERFWAWIRSWITNFFCVWTQLSPGTVPVDWIEHG